MLGDYDAGELRFAGVGAEGPSANEAAELLAAALNHWAEEHGASRIQQLSVLHAVRTSGSDAASAFGAMALIAYTEAALEPGIEAEVVAAAIEEIHEAQAEGDLAEELEPPP